MTRFWDFMGGLHKVGRMMVPGYTGLGKFCTGTSLGSNAPGGSAVEGMAFIGRIMGGNEAEGSGAGNEAEGSGTGNEVEGSEAGNEVEGSEAGNEDEIDGIVAGIDVDGGAAGIEVDVEESGVSIEADVGTLHMSPTSEMINQTQMLLVNNDRKYDHITVH